MFSNRAYERPRVAASLRVMSDWSWGLVVLPRHEIRPIQVWLRFLKVSICVLGRQELGIRVNVGEVMRELRRYRAAPPGLLRIAILRGHVSLLKELLAQFKLLQLAPAVKFGVRLRGPWRVDTDQPRTRSHRGDVALSRLADSAPAIFTKALPSAMLPKLEHLLLTLCQVMVAARGVSRRADRRVCRREIRVTTASVC